MAQLGELSPAASIAVGILVGLLSTAIQGVGLTLQRKSHLLEDEKEDELVRRPPYRRRRWQLGMLMFIIANLVGSSIQITTLPLPVLSTLQASGLVFNTICATLILAEPFTRWSLGGTVLVAGGAVLIALFGALPEPSHNLVQLLELLGRPQFIAWLVCTFLAIAAILILTLVLSRIHHPHTPRLRLAIGMSYGSISAILSAHSLLVAKSAVELLVRTIVDGVNQFNRWQSWIILLGLVVLALSQLYFLHRGLKLCSTSVLYPFVFCIYNVIAILDGLIYFHQTDRLPPLHAGLIALGTVILLAGVLALSWRLGAPADSEAPPPPPQQTLLTPGMGIVEDTTTESPTPTSSLFSSPSAYASDDEEAGLGIHTETTPLLGPRRSSLQLPRARRQRFAADPDEIWSALQDDKERATAPPRRRAGSAGAADMLPSPHPGLARSKTVGETPERAWEQRRRRRKLDARHRSASTPLPGYGGVVAAGRRRRRYRQASLAGWLLDWWRGDGERRVDGQAAGSGDVPRADDAQIDHG